MKLKRCSTACLALALAVLLLLPLAPRVYAEAGNEFNSAQAINVNTAYTDATSTANDYDYFRFSLSKAGTVTLRFAHKDLVSTSSYWYVHLYNDRQKEICVWTVDGSGEIFDGYLVGLDKGTYYLRVNSANKLSKDNYRLQVNFTATNDCEKENNNEFAAATQIRLNADIQGTTNDAQDMDYYSFSLSKPGTVTLTFTREDLVSTTSYWYVHLYNDRQKEICLWTVNGSGESFDGYLVGLDQGTYYLRVNSANKLTTNTYRLRMNYTATSDCEKENNNEFAAATQIRLDTDILGTTSDAQDQDYYSFSLSKPGTVSLTFTRADLVSNNSYWYVHLYNDRQKEICLWTVNGNGEVYEGYLVGLDKGTYYLRVNSANKLTTNTYRLRMNYTATDDSEKELNEAFDAASPIAVNTPILGTTNDAQDADYYVFTLDEASNVRLRLAHEDLVDKSTYWRFTLYDDRHTEITRGTFNANGTAGETGLTVLGAGTYYVFVASSNKLTTGTYALTVLTYCSGGDECPGRFFTDMPAVDNWAHEPIDWAVENKITAGTSKTTFSPASTCTRAQVVTFLWRAKGQPTPKNRYNPFQDVSVNDYYYKAVLWAVENKITAGTSRTTFSPNSGCTRGQVVTFLWRMEGQPIAKAEDGQDGAYNPFKDVKQGDYFYDAVLWAVEQGITKGTGPDTFAPGRTCTRAQIVSFLHRDLVQ